MAAQPKPEHAFDVGDELAVVEIATGKLQRIAAVTGLWHTGDVMFGATGTRFRQDGVEIVYPERIYGGSRSYGDWKGYGSGPRPYREVSRPPRLMVRHATDADRAEMERRRLRHERIEAIRSFAAYTFNPYDTRPTLESLSDDQIARIAAIVAETPDA